MAAALTALDYAAGRLGTNGGAELRPAEPFTCVEDWLATAGGALTRRA